MNTFFGLNKFLKHQIRSDAIRLIRHDRESLATQGLVWFESILYDQRTPTR